MERFFEAKSVALVGVSNSKGNLGRLMVFNMTEFRYSGVMYLVGPKGGAFLGHKIYPSVLELPEPVDLAVVLIPAQSVPEVLRQCGERGIERVVIESGGFGELGEERGYLESQMREIIEHYRLRVMGPNCIGIINRRSGLAVPFMPFKAEAAPGRISIVSQSGGVGGTMVNSMAAENIGFSKFASIGNKLNINENDLLDYFSRDSETDLTFCYIEGIADGRRLMEIAARSAKPIIVHKSNRGQSGSVIARSHSTSLSTDDAVVDAAFRQCGMIRVNDQREAVELFKGMLLPPMHGPRLAIISRSGGHAVMAADAADEFGFELPPFPPEMIALVHQHSRAQVIDLHNPMDLGDLYHLPLYRELAERALGRDEFDGLLFVYNYQGTFDAEESRKLIAGLGELSGRFNKPAALCLFTMKKELDFNRRAVSSPIFTDPREALRVLAAVRDRACVKPLPLAIERPPGLGPACAAASADLASGPVAPGALAAILESYRVPLIPFEVVYSEQTVLDAARRIGLPVALKTANPEVLHKTDVGAVRLHLAEDEAVRQAYRQLAEFGPAVLVQKMAAPGIEWFVGGRQDRQFGPVVVVGLGGIYVELLKETAIRVAPVMPAEVEKLIEESRGAALLSGVRGEPPPDRKAFVDLIVKVSWLLTDCPHIQELDLNPVRIRPAGCQILDWRALSGSS